MLVIQSKEQNLNLMVASSETKESFNKYTIFLSSD